VFVASPVVAQTTTDSASKSPISLHKDKDSRGIFSLTWENDLFSGEDDNYTNGVRIAWFSSETDVPEWLEDGASTLPFFNEDGSLRYGFALGQSMFTPENISRRDVILNDRPYAGWTYGSVALVSDTGERLDSLLLQVGIVGPGSGAAETQDFVHHVVGSPDPRGWGNQLENEPGAVLFYERKWRNLYEYTPFGLAADFTPHVGGALGNVFTYGAVGGAVRLGYDLPTDYGVPRIRPAQSGSDFFEPTQYLGGYLFAGVEGRAVGRNIFLDGNTFENSHSVDKKYFVADLYFGAALTWYNTRLAYTHIFRTPEFEEQSDIDSYGALTLSYRF
jgi:hypothetical protein